MSDSKIRKFPLNEEMSSQEKIQDKLFHRMRTRIYTILLILAVVAVAVTSYIVYERTKTYTGFEITNTFALETSSGTKVTEFSGNILSYSKDGAQSMDAKGNLLWNITFDMQSPLMTMCDDTVAFADYGGSTIYVQTTDGESFEVSTDMPIRKIAASDNGIVAAILEDVGVTWIYLYDSRGETIAYFRTTMEKSGYPVDLCLSPSGEVAGLSYYFLDIGDVKSSVAFYNFGEVGQNNIDNYVSGYNYSDTLVPYVRFLTDDHCFSLSSERLSIYEGAHKPVSAKDVFLTDEVKSVFYDDSHIGLVLANTEDENDYRLEIYSADGSLISKKTFDFDYSAVAFGGDCFVLYGNREVYVSTYGGTVKLDAEYDSTIRFLMPGQADDKLVVVTDNSVDTVTLK